MEQSGPDFTFKTVLLHLNATLKSCRRNAVAHPPPTLRPPLSTLKPNPLSGGSKPQWVGLSSGVPQPIFANVKSF